MKSIMLYHNGDRKSEIIEKQLHESGAQFETLPHCFGDTIETVVRYGDELWVGADIFLLISGIQNVRVSS